MVEDERKSAAYLNKWVLLSVGCGRQTALFFRTVRDSLTTAAQAGSHNPVLRSIIGFRPLVMELAINRLERDS